MSVCSCVGGWSRLPQRRTTTAAHITEDEDKAEDGAEEEEVDGAEEEDVSVALALA
jgi:hypothetical protein